MDSVCQDIGSIIVTIAIITHGGVVEANIEHDKLNNTRIFSLAGTFSPSVGTSDFRQNNLNYLNQMFQKDIGDTFSLVQEFGDTLRPKYESYLESFAQDMSRENTCRLFENITIDKIFTTKESSWMHRLGECVFQSFKGIFVISVHEKRGPNNLKLLYSAPTSRFKKIPNLNLLDMSDLEKFAQIFGKHAHNNLMDESAALPNPGESLEGWTITMKTPQTIESIRMSRLAEIIKEIVGEDRCKLNLLDYSCFSTQKYLPETELSYLQYFEPSDIERPAGKTTWGGVTRRRKKQRKNKKKSKRRTKKKNELNVYGGMI